MPGKVSWGKPSSAATATVVSPSLGVSPVQSSDANARAGNRGDEHEFAFPAEEQVRAVQRAIDRRLPERAHPITAPLLKSVFKRSAANTMSEMTRTSMMRRRTNSLISPPKTRMAPVTTMPRSEMA